MWPPGWRRQFFNSIHSLSQLGVRALCKGVRNQVRLAQAFRGKSGPHEGDTLRPPWHISRYQRGVFDHVSVDLVDPLDLLWFLRGFAGATGGKPE